METPVHLQAFCYTYTSPLSYAGGGSRKSLMKPAPPPRPPSLDRPYTEHSYMWDALYDPQQKRLFKGSHACLSKAPWTGNVEQWSNIPALAACQT